MFSIEMIRGFVQGMVDAEENLKKLQIKNHLYALSNRVTCRSRKITCVIVNNRLEVVGEGTNNPDPTMDCVSYARSLGHVFEDDGRCPRRILGFKSGQGLELCRARHAERESIKDAQSKGIDTHGLSMFMDCECPCHECATAIKDAGIKTIHIKDHPDYDPRGRAIMTAGGVEIKTWFK
jgi:dCMP deaminase